MRGVTPENYQKVRPVFKLNEETIFEPLKVEKTAKPSYVESFRMK